MICLYRYFLYRPDVSLKIVGIFPVTNGGNVLLVFFAVVVVIADRMWRKLPKDHPGVYQEAIPECR